jgi:hypothetical protein
MITIRSTVQRKRDALSAEVAGEMVLMSVDLGQYYGLDSIGSTIWRRLDSPVVVGDLCASLGSEYKGDPSVIERDVIALLEKLDAHGLLDAGGAEAE